MPLENPLFRSRRFLVPAVVPRSPGSTVSAKPNAQLLISVEQFLPRRTTISNGTTGVTLLFTHGTGFNKELYRKVVGRLLSHCKSPIRQILTMDAVNHASSAVANENFLGSQFNWDDHSYDILHVLDYFNGCAPAVGIGHSFGGGAM